jgi:hypothetical protein
MVFHLAAPYIQDQLSLRSWKPGGTLTVRVKYRGPFRLPAVRVTGVLVGPAQERTHGGGALRIASGSRGAASGSGAAGAGPGVSPFSQAARGAKFWDSSKAVASSAVTMWNNMVETHSARWSQSLQTLQRVGSRILRSMSHDSVPDAAGEGGEGGAPAGGAGEAPAGAGDAGFSAAALPPASLEQQHQAAAMAAAMAAAHAAAAAAVADAPSLQEQEALLQRQLDQLGHLQASLSRFVTTASRREVNQACMLADLSNIAYDVQQILDGSLLESRHGLRLVACSHPDHAPSPGGEACVLPGGGPAAAAARQAAEVEALIEMSLAPQWEAWESEEAAAAASAAVVRLMAGPAGPAATCWDGPAGGAGGGAAQLSPRAPAFVSAMAVLDDDAGAAGAACCSASGAGARVATTAAGSIAAPGSPAAGARRRGAPAGALAAAACLDAPLAAAPAPWPLPPHQHHFQQQQQQHAWVAPPQPECTDEPADAFEPAPLPADPSAASAPAAPAIDSEPLPAAGPRGAAAPAPSHPADWFVCDAPADEATGAAPTRFIVIQGSITVDHWRINLTFDPVPFENESTGVKVHRCVHRGGPRPRRRGRAALAGRGRVCRAPKPEVLQPRRGPHLRPPAAPLPPLLARN